MEHNQETNDILEHYGVVGMKWGRRKGDGSTAGQRLKARTSAAGTSDTITKSGKKTKIKELKESKRERRMPDKSKWESQDRATIEARAKKYGRSYEDQKSRDSAISELGKSATSATIASSFMLAMKNT